MFFLLFIEICLCAEVVNLKFDSLVSNAGTSPSYCPVHPGFHVQQDSVLDKELDDG